MTSNDVDFLALQPVGAEALLFQSPAQFADGNLPPLAGNIAVSLAGVASGLPLTPMPLLWQSTAGPNPKVESRGGWTAATSADTTQTTSPSIVVAPVGGVQVANNDLLLLAITVDHPSTNISTAAFSVDQATTTGWTRIGPIADTGSPNDHKAVWFYTKWHDGDPTTFTVTCTFAVEWALSAAAWSGTSDTTPVGSYGYTWETGTTTATHTTKPLTTATTGAWVGVTNHDRGGGAWTPPATYTERADVRVTGGTGVAPSVEIADSGVPVAKGLATQLTSTSTTASSTAVNLIFEIVPFAQSSNPPPQVVYGPVLGALTSSSVTAVYGFSGLATTARLQVSTDPTLVVSPIFGSAVADDAYGITTLTVTGLAADTTYYYGVESDGSLNAVGQGTFRTDPTAGTQTSFSVAFGSCQYDAVTSPAFELIRTRVGAAGQRARRLIHMGDFNYQDWGASDTFNDIITFWNFQVNQAAIAPCLANVPITYQWDNHDWGGSNSDKDNVRAADVAAAMRKMIPHYTLPASDGVGSWYSYVIGRVRFIQFDPRSQRDNYLATNGPTKTMMGVEQKAWFKGQLDQSEPVKIIQANMYWRQGSTDNDRWGSYLDEFAELNTYISTNASGSVGHVYVIAGDRHAITADDGTSLGAGQSTMGVPQAIAIFQQGSEDSHETWSQAYYSGPEPNPIVGYGWLDITDAGSSITIAFDGRSANDNVTQVSMTTVFQLGATASVSTIAPPVVVISGTASVSTSALASVSTISPVKVVVTGAGSAQAGTVVVPSTIAPPVVVMTGAGSAQVITTPATIAPPAVAVTGAGSAQTGTTVTVSTVAPPVVVVGAVSVLTGSTVLPSTISPPVVVISGTATGAGVITAATITPTKVVISGTGQAGQTVTVSTVAPPVVIVTGAGSAQAGAVVVPATVAGTVAVPAVTVTVTNVITPATVAGAVAVPAVTLTSAVLVTPSTVSPAKVVVSGTAQTGVTVTVSTMAGSVTVPAVVVTSPVLIFPSTIAPPKVVVSVGVRTGQTVTVATIVGVALLPLITYFTDLIPYRDIESRGSITGEPDTGGLTVTGTVS